MKSLVLLLTGLMIPLTGWAEQGDLPIRTSGFYFGAALGSGAAEISTDLGNISGADTAYRVTVGYRWWNTFMPWDIDLGLEAGYLDLGERDNALSDGNQWQLENSGITAALVGFLPVSRHFELLGKGGLLLADNKLSNISLNVPSASKSTTDVLIGVGIAYRTAGAWSAALEYEYSGTLDGTSLASAAIYYQFK